MAVVCCSRYDHSSCAARRIGRHGCVAGARQPGDDLGQRVGRIAMVGRFEEDVHRVAGRERSRQAAYFADQGQALVEDQLGGVQAIERVPGCARGGDGVGEGREADEGNDDVLVARARGEGGPR